MSALVDRGVAGDDKQGRLGGSDGRSTGIGVTPPQAHRSLLRNVVDFQ
jgi:hypothetical protein